MGENGGLLNLFGMVGNNPAGHADFLGLEETDGIDMDVLKGDLNLEGEFPVQTLALPESGCGTCPKKDSSQVIPPGAYIPSSVDVYVELHGKLWPEFGGGTVFNIPADLGCVELDPVDNKFYSRRLIDPGLTAGERLSEDDDHRRPATREEIHWFFAAQLKATIDANVKNPTDKTLTMMLAAGPLRANSDLIALNTTREMTLGQATATVLGVTVVSIKAREAIKKMRAAKTPFQIAEEGGRHAGFLKNYRGKSPSEMRNGIASFEKQIAEHRAKLADPESAIPGFKLLDPRQQKALLESKWPSDIQRQQEQMSILKSLLGED